MISDTDFFDNEKFYTLLLDASRVAFTNVRREFPHETFYDFFLGRSAESTLIYPWAATEETLTLMVKWLREEVWLSKAEGLISLDETRLILRYRLGTNINLEKEPYRSLFEPLYKILNGREEKIYDVIRRLADEREKSEFRDSYWNNFYDVCARVMRQLDVEGVFGTGELRNKCVIGLREHQRPVRSGKLLSYIQALNPLEVYERYLSEIKAMDELFDRLNR